MTQISRAELRGLFDSMEAEAFRFEAQPHYEDAEERPVMEAFLAGQNPPGPDAYDWWRPWLDRIRSITASGRRVVRVRVLDAPPTPYQRFGLWYQAWLRGSGEQIAYIGRATICGVLSGTCDWWLFDRSQVVTMQFDVAGNMTRIDLLTDPAVAAPYVALRDWLAEHAAPTSDAVTA